jgi:hypothetical protein
MTVEGVRARHLTPPPNPSPWRGGVRALRGCDRLSRGESGRSAPSPHCPCNGERVGVRGSIRTEQAAAPHPHPLPARGERGRTAPPVNVIPARGARSAAESAGTQTSINAKIVAARISLRPVRSDRLAPWGRGRRLRRVRGATCSGASSQAPHPNPLPRGERGYSSTPTDRHVACALYLPSET